MLQLLIAGLMGLSVTLIFTGLALRRQPDEVAARLDRYGARAVPESLRELELQAPFSERALKPLLRSISQVVARFTPARTIESTRHNLELAGRPNNWTVADFLGVRGLSAIIAGGLPFLFLLISRAPVGRLLLFTAGFLILGFILPSIWLGRKIRERQTDILKSLPDALDMMTIAIEAGLGFDSAMQKVCDKWDNELTKTFRRALSEMRVGRTRREALRDMASRVGLEELTSFVAAVLQADQLGVSMAKVMRIQSEQMRIRRRQRAEEAAQKAPIKMLIPMAFLIFPSLFIILLGPAVPVFMEGFL
jgi:tight adherence protein C